MAAAYELTRPEQRDRFEVTVYQQGWRLGGKGASGRGAHGRIEEHGLHVWLGFYENAFKMLRSVYAELDRDPRTCPLATWRDAFFPAAHVGLAHEAGTGDWSFWSSVFPQLPGEPGDGGDALPGRDLLLRATEVMRALFRLAYDPGSERTDLPPDSSSTMGARAREALATGLGLLDAVAGAVQHQLRERDAVVALEAVVAALDRVRPSHRDARHRQRAAEVLELVAAAMLGTLREGLLHDPSGFDRIDDVDFADWLRSHGASQSAVASPFLRGLYSLMFAFEGGDPDRPRAAAGRALRGCTRMFFGYKGAFFWKMGAGMGDVVFAPLFEVLRRRGVRFEFFHRLTDVRVAVDGGERWVDALELDVQAQTREGAAYEPLVDVCGAPSWPSEPDWAQLAGGDALRRDGVDFESFWERRRARSVRLEVRRDFDFVVLGVSIGEIPHVCRDILAIDARWRAMVEHLGTVATQAMQLWVRAPTSALGWQRGPVTLTAFAPPFDTWADMTHLLPLEAWPEGDAPRGLAYFCNALDERRLAEARPMDAGHPARAHELVAEDAQAWIDRDLAALWPAIADGAAWVHSSFVRANVNPSDRYVQCLPGTPRHRISPLDRTYDNMTIAGDWTRCGLDLGCVEAAVMSGMLAAHALSELPRLDEIVGL
jgi:uncharacterized protein with NAD-binding domain and iron-sulfur cluster